jgi:hypothetical protein
MKTSFATFPFAVALLALASPDAHAGKAALMCSAVDNVDPTNRFQFRIRNPQKAPIPAGAQIKVRATMALRTKADRPFVNYSFSLANTLSPAAATMFEGAANAKSCTASAEW